MQATNPNFSGGLVFRLGHSPKHRQHRYPVSSNYFTPLDMSLHQYKD
jgi:hypothetical protein